MGVVMLHNKYCVMPVLLLSFLGLLPLQGMAVTFTDQSEDGSPCVLLEQCCPLWQLWESRHIRVATSSTISTLSSSICGWAGNTPLYSCLVEPLPPPTGGGLPCKPWLLQVIQDFLEGGVIV